MKNPPLADLRRQAETKIALSRRLLPASNLLLLLPLLKTVAIILDFWIAILDFWPDGSMALLLLPGFYGDDGADGRPEGRR